MSRHVRYALESRGRAVRVVLEHQGWCESQWAVNGWIAGKMGCTPETLRKWVQQAGRAQGLREGLGTSECEGMKALEREVRERKPTNEIRRKASAFFAQAKLERRCKR